jgi:hypothetical protein
MTVSDFETGAISYHDVTFCCITATVHWYGFADDEHSKQ